MTGETGSSEQEKRRLAECPHCGKPIRVTFRIQVEVTDGSEEAGNFDWKTLLPHDVRSLLEAAIATGLMKAFSETVFAAKPPDQVPRDLERYFVTILGKMMMRVVSKRIHMVLYRHFGSRELQFWSTDSVGMVVSDGRIRAFLPATLVIGKNIKSLTGKRIVEYAEESSLEQWFADHPLTPMDEHINYDRLQMGAAQTNLRVALRGRGQMIAG